MAEKTEFLQAIDDAILDADSLEKFINGDDTQDVLTRLSKRYPTLQKALKELFNNNGIAGRFKTLSDLQASDLQDDSYALVADDVDDKNGIYIKEGGAWVLSEYNPEVIAKEYTDETLDRLGLNDLTNKSYNLFDPSKLIYGKVIRDTGKIEDFANYSISPFIRVEPSEVYQIYSDSGNAFSNVALYNINKNFIRRVDLFNKDEPDNTLFYTMPSNVHYIRVNINENSAPSSIYDKMIAKGSELLPFKDGTVQVGTAVSYTDSKLAELGLDDLVYKSYNLFNPLLIEKGVIIDSSGALLPNGAYAISDYIPVAPNMEYFAYSDAGVAFPSVAQYDKDKKFLWRSDISGYSDGGAIVKVFPDVQYVRLNLNVAHTPLETAKRMFTFGNTAKPYVSGIKRLKDVALPDPSMWGIDDLSGLVKSLTIDGEALATVKTSENLYVLDKITRGYSIASDGAITPSNDYSFTDFIQVVQGESLSLSAIDQGASLPFNYIAYYDKDRKFISRAASSTLTLGYSEDPKFPGRVYGTLTVPSNGAAYVRLLSNRIIDVGKKDRMITRGAENKPYVSGAAKLLGASISQHEVDNIITNNSIKVGRELVEPVHDWYKADSSLFTGFEDWKTRSSNEVHQLWSDLQAKHSSAMSKQTIGNDSLGNPMYLYTVKPDKAAPDEYAPKPYKIFVACSIHGAEKVPSLAAYLMVREMLKRDAPKELQALRANCELLIIPLANPSGWDLNSRTNSNSVDLNRNFPYAWTATDPSSPTYGGTEPLSEPEAQNINSVLLANPDIDAAYDFHNFFGGSQAFIWIPTAFDRPETVRVGQAYLSRLTRQYRSDFEWIPDESWHCGLAERYYREPMLSNYAASLGAKYSATFEVRETWAVDANIPDFGPEICKCWVEAISNWLLINIHFLSQQKG